MSAYKDFDRIFCITLSGQKERHAYLQNVFKQLNINPELYIAQRSVNGLVGCFTSHYEVWKIAQNRGYNNILVFEDDIFPTPGYQDKIIQHVASFAKNNKEWEYMQLGYGFSKISDNIALDFIKLIKSPKKTNHLINYAGAFTHVYCMSAKGIDKAIKMASYELSKPPNEVQHVDLWLLKIFNPKACYAVIPMQFDQNWCFNTTNISKNAVETIARNFSCFEKRNQLFYKWSLLVYYRVTIIIILMLFVIAIFLLFNNIK